MADIFCEFTLKSLSCPSILKAYFVSKTAFNNRLSGLLTLTLQVHYLIWQPLTM